MAWKSTGRLYTLAGGLLLVAEVSGFFLTLSNFQSISPLSIPLGCVFAYNSPLQGCVAEDFGNGRTCSPSCQRAIDKVQTNIQQSCVLVSAGERSLLNQAQNGKLVVALCGNMQPPPRSTSIVSRPPPQSFTQIPPVSSLIPATTSTTQKIISSSDSSSVLATTGTTQQIMSSSDSPTPQPTPTVMTTSIPASISSSSSRVDDGSFSSSDTSTASVSITSSFSTWQQRTTGDPPQSTTTSSTTRSPEQTQARGGGGSPFDIVPGSAAHLGGGQIARMYAFVSCLITIYLS